MHKNTQNLLLSLGLLLGLLAGALAGAAAFPKELTAQTCNRKGCNTSTQACNSTDVDLFCVSLAKWGCSTTTCGGS